MSDPRQLSDFPYVSREDTISVTDDKEKIVPPDVEFVLETTSDVRWWKALELRDSSGHLISSIETQDDNHGPVSMTFAAGDLVGTHLTLAKAKQWGHHTGMYELIDDLWVRPGRSIQFLWQRDTDKAGFVAGFFRDIGNAINIAADAVADAVETVIETVAEVVSTIVETVGNVFAGFLETLGDIVAGIPIIGPILKGIFHWVATVVSAVFDWIATSIKAGLDLVGNWIGGMIRIVGGAVGGLLAWDARLFVKGINDAVAGVVGAVVAIAGKAAAVIQATMFMQLGERELTVDEEKILRRVYRNSVMLSKVRVVDGFTGVFSLGGKFALGNRIYMKGSHDMALLVHECCHVWQHQHHGTRYVADALFARTDPKGYEWQAELAKGRLRWQDFNAEAQAKFLQDVFVYGTQPDLPPGTLGRFYYDDPVALTAEFLMNTEPYTSLARDAVAYVRGAPWPLATP